MTDRQPVEGNAVSIVIPAVALLVVALPGEPRWTRRPWLVSKSPSRRVLALFFAVLLAVAVLHVLV